MPGASSDRTVIEQRYDSSRSSRIAELEAENVRLRRSEGHYRAVVESANDFAIFTTGLDGLITSWNPGAEKLLGWSETEAVGQHACMIFTPEDEARDACDREMDIATRSGRAEDERWHCRKNGSGLWGSGLMMRFEDEQTGKHVGFLKILRDRTSQHEANEKLRDSEALARALLESTGDCVKLLDLDGRLHSINGPGLCVMEIDDFSTFVGRDWATLWPADRRDEARAAVEDAKAGRLGRFDGFCPTIKNTPKWWDVQVSPVLGADGKPRMLLSVSRDMTARAHDQQALGESEARFRNMADHAPVMIWVTDASGYCTYLNPRWYEFTGQTKVEAEGFGWMDATHPDDKAEAKQLFLTANAGREPFRAEYRLRHADGTYRWSIDAASPRFGEDGTFLGHVGSVIDIDDRHDMEDALVHRTEQLQGLAAAALVVARAPTLEATLDSITQAARQIIGAHQGVVSLTRGPDWSQAINAVALTDKYAAWRDYETMPGGGGIYAWLCDTNRPARLTQAELEAHPSWRGFGPHAADHSPMRGWLAAPLVARDGRNLGLIQLSDKEDGSEFDEADEAMLVQLAQFASAAVEQTQADAELRELNESLERRVAAAIAEREQTEEVLRQAQKMEAVGQLTGGIAHDFNNLLTGIIGSLDMMQRRVAMGETDKVARYTAMALTSANRAAAMTHRLLAFSRQQPLDPKPVDANRLVNEMAELLRRTIGESIQLEIDVADGLWRTLCDPNQLESAILNLAINARDAMPDGGKLTVETCNIDLKQGSAVKQQDIKPGEYVCIRVTDTGTGMDKSTIDKAFEPFFTTKPIGLGTGLGLSMIYGFTRQSEGYARIHSTIGLGTTIELYLPRHHGIAEDVDDRRRELTNEHRAEDGEVVLVVEDEPAVRELVVEVLQELGYQAVEAADGHAGLKLLQSNMKLDLLVTDIGLPGLNGRQIAAAGRQHRPDLKVLFMTGYAESTTVADGFLEPGMEMITKPFAVDVLLTRIRAMIESRSY